jgi:hypothetical protein
LNQRRHFVFLLPFLSPFFFSKEEKVQRIDISTKRGSF